MAAKVRKANVHWHLCWTVRMGSQVWLRDVDGDQGALHELLSFAKSNISNTFLDVTFEAVFKNIQHLHWRSLSA